MITGHILDVWKLSRTKNLLMLILFLPMLESCGQNSQADCETAPSSQCQPLSEDEQSVILLNEGKTNEAISLLEQLILEEDETYYVRNVRLAAAYGIKARLDLPSLLEAFQNNASSSLFSEDMTLLNKDTFLDRIVYMNKAVDIIEKIPEDHRKKTSELSESEKSDKFYSGSANTQYFLYSSVHTVLCEKTLSFISANLTERYLLSSDEKGESCGPLSVLNDLQSILTQIDTDECDEVCAKVSENIDDINQKISDIIGEETDITKATDILLSQLCEEQKQTNPEIDCSIPDIPL